MMINLVLFWLKLNKMCKLLNSYEQSLHCVGVNLKNVYENALFSGKIYTDDKNFTRLPVVAVITNINSDHSLGI